MKYLYNPATDSFEALDPTLRERFSLGSKDPSPKLKTDGEVAGALMNTFPGSNMDYLQAVEDGFQGTLEDFLKLQSIPQSDRPLTGELDIGEQDMKDIEGQVAFGGFLKNLLKPSDDVAKQIAKTKTSKRGPEFNILKKKDPENYTEAEKLFEQNLTEKFQAIADDPLYKDLIPKKYKNIRSITEISSSDFDKISKNFTDFQFKSITDEKGLGPYSSLSERLKTQVKGLYSTREAAKKRPDFFSLDIAGDTFNFPYMKNIDPKAIKNFENLYPTLKKIESNSTVENYYKQIGKLNRGEKLILNDIQAYLTGVDTRARPIFKSPHVMKLLKSLDLENKLSEETIELLKTQKGQEAANKFKQAKATKEAAKVNLAKVNTKSIQRINEIYTFDPDATAREVIDQYYGNSIKNKSKPEQAKMLKELRNDIITYYKIISNTRKPVKGVRRPSKEKVDNILTSIMESKGKDSFDIYGGYLRNIYSDIADSITKPGFKYQKKTSDLSKQFSGQHVDHSAGLTAVHDVAPGYVEAVQIIPKAVNQNKGRLLDRAATGIINDFFTNTPNKLRKIGDKEYKTFAEKVDAFNTISKQFADANGIDTPLLRFGEPGKGPSPKETVEYFSEFSKGARDNMMEVWKNHGFVIYTKSRPMQSPYWKTLKNDIISKRQIKNMGGLVSRVNFFEGTKIDQFTDTLEKGPNPVFDQVIASLDNTDLINNLEEENKQTLEEQIYGEEGDRTMMQRFNTMFADPRAIPYYASKIVEGATRIPEYAVRTVPALASLGSETVANLVSDRYPEGKVERFLDRVSPKITDAAQEKIGLKSLIAEQEKNRTTPQQFTGGVLELAGELPGPATPLFLLKAPKYIKELRNLAGGASAAKELERKIEERVAVDQGRRDFNKVLAVGGVMGLLKSLGLDKLIGTGAKVAQKAAPEIITSGGTPKYFFDFVDLIKRKGTDVSDEASTVAREKVYTHDGYTVYEKLDTGEIRISKETEGGGSYYIGDGEYEIVEGIIRKEEIGYSPPETIINDKGKPVKALDNYEEYTLKPDVDGSDGDVDAGLESIDEILEMLSKDGKTYTDKELLKMGIDPNLTNVPTGAGTIPVDMVGQPNPFKPKKAGGGIIKLAGDDSGPPPKSGPTPHGLPYVAKNVRPIKERK